MRIPVAATITIIALERKMTEASPEIVRCQKIDMNIETPIMNWLLRSKSGNGGPFDTVLLSRGGSSAGCQEILPLFIDYTCCARGATSEEADRNGQAGYSDDPSSPCQRLALHHLKFGSSSRWLRFDVGQINK